MRKTGAGWYLGAVVLVASCVLPGLAVAQPAAGQGTAQPVAATSGEVVSTRYGPVRLFADARDGSGEGGEAVFGAQRIKLPGYGLSLEASFQMPEADLLVLTSGSGARGMPPAYFLIQVTAQGMAELSAGKDFSTADHTFRMERTGIGLVFDLGFENKRKKKAVYRDGVLTVEFAPSRPDEPLKRETCADLLNTVVQCLGKEECAGDSLDLFAMGTQRMLFALDNTPGFSSDTFFKVCREICRSRRYDARAARQRICHY